ncbi:MAG TPA: DUF4491 family protein [Anaerolineales bacterium]|nr:DUF4491 family protein [Anaerolineales bacterium]
MSLNPIALGMGLFMLLAIGLGFVWVIKVEYYFGAHVWPYVLVVGASITLASLFMPTFTLSALLGILGGSVMWGATELPGQAARVRRGLFPANPRRANSPEQER